MLGPNEEEVVDEEGVVWIRNRYTDEYQLKESQQALRGEESVVEVSAERDIDAAVRSAQESLRSGGCSPAAGGRARPFYSQATAASSATSTARISASCVARKRQQLKEDKANDAHNWQQFSRQDDCFRCGECFACLCSCCKRGTSAYTHTVFSRQPTRGTVAAECGSFGR